MSNTNTNLSKTMIFKPGKSGHDCSHEVLTTSASSWLYPLMCDELMPGTKVSLGALCNVELPPFVTKFYGKIDYKLEAFFVPARLCWGGWKDFISRQNQLDPDLSAPQRVPVLKNARFDPKSLYEALGYGANSVSSTTQHSDRSILPLIAYAKIWDDWYRDARIQKSCLKPASSVSSAVVSNLPFTNITQDVDAATSTFRWANGMSAQNYLLRNYAKDYFTAAQLKQSLGNNVNISVPVADSTGTLSIAQIREANSLQLYNDILGASGVRYEDISRNLWGVRPPDETVQKAIYLGSSTNTIYNNSIVQHMNASGDELNRSPYTNTPVGSSSQGNTTLSDSLANFEAKEFGYLIVLGSVLPHAYYSQVYDKKFRHTAPSDFGTPILAGMGNQPILKSELVGPGMPDNQDGTFGWIDRYAEYKFKHDVVKGEFGPTGSLSCAVMSRNWSTAPSLGSTFLQNYGINDNVFLFNDESGIFDICKIDCYFNYKVVNPLPAFSIPTLGAPIGMHTEVIEKAGTRL